MDSTGIGGADVVQILVNCLLGARLAVVLLALICLTHSFIIRPNFFLKILFFDHRSPVICIRF